MPSAFGNLLWQVRHFCELSLFQLQVVLPQAKRRGGQSRLAVRMVVGMTGFEPATSRTPSVCATRLRHIPSGLSPYALMRQSIIQPQDVSAVTSLSLFTTLGFFLPMEGKQVGVGRGRCKTER
jgi:hypothetical protein